MDDAHEPRDEVATFLQGHAAALDRGAASIGAEEAREQTVARSLEPSRWRSSAIADSRSRRRPAIAAAVVAALLIGSVVGFAAGHTSAPPSHAVVARGAASDTTTPTVVPAAAPLVSDRAAPYTPATVTRLFIRTTTDGIVLRGYSQGYELADGGGACNPNSWCPPAECSSGDMFQAEVNNDLAVSQSGTQSLPLDGPAANRGEVPLGLSEGAPASVVMVQTTSDVANVRGTWPDGAVDEMPPVNGWALVAHAGSTSPSAVEAILNDGSSVPIGDVAVYPQQCQAPPPAPPDLPAAGADQPADADSARAAITNAYQTVFTHGSDPETNAQYMEDAENIQPVAAKVKGNYSEATSTITVDIGEIRFQSPTEAALYFELKYTGGALFGKQIGYATLIDGTWKISRDTLCMVFSWGGGQCDPPPDPARSTATAN
jgi:hypothetical protein